MTIHFSKIGQGSEAVGTQKLNIHLIAPAMATMAVAEALSHCY